MHCEKLFEHFIWALDLLAFISLIAADKLKVEVLSVVAEFVF